MEKTIFIKRISRKVDAVRINSEKDIPQFLSNSLRTDDEFIYYQTFTGESFCPIGSMIGWDTTDLTNTGYYCWQISHPEDTLIEEDGVFYAKPDIFKAQKISDTLPDFLKEGCTVNHHADGSWVITTNSGVSLGKPGEAYWVLYGTNNDGSLNADILHDWEYPDYMICDKNGNGYGPLK